MESWVSSVTLPIYITVHVLRKSGPVVPPPLPPRPSPAPGLYNEGVYGYNSYGGPGGYGNTYYGGGGYSMYGRYGYGGGVGLPYQAQESNIVRMAEESSRSAFQSVESVVQGFASVSMMLESSYSAIYNSFRAILGVADQFSRLKAHFAHIFSTLAVIRILRWLWRRILVFLRLKPANYANSSAEIAWNSAQSSHHFGSNNSLSWSSFTFFLITIGGPWIIWKILSKISGYVENSRRWARGEGDHFEAKVLYTFNAVEENELPMTAGSVVRIAPKELQPAMRGWLMAASVDGHKIGLVPMNYIEIIGRRNGPTPENDRDLEKAYAIVS